MWFILNFLVLLLLIYVPMPFCCVLVTCNRYINENNGLGVFETR